MMTWKIVVGLMLFSFLVIISGSTTAKTIVVDDDGGDWSDHQSIQDALSDAIVGDTIRVYEGLYDELVSIHTSDITIIGNGTSDTLVTNGNERSTLVNAWADNVRIQGLKFDGQNELEEGINIRNEGISIIDCEIVNMTSRGIQVFNARDFTISGCYLNTSNSGMSIVMSSNGSVNQCIFTNNSFGGIGINSYTTDISITNCLISDHRMYGVFLTSGYTVIDNTTFEGTGIMISPYHDNDLQAPHIVNCTLNGHPILYLLNESGKDITLEGGQLILINCSNIVSIVTSADAHCYLTILSSFDINATNFRLGSSWMSHWIQNSRDVVLHNCSAVDSFYGFLLQNCTNITLMNCSAEEISAWGITVSQCNKINFVGCDIQANLSDIHLSESINCAFIRCKLKQGINFYGSEPIHFNSHRIDNCTVKDGIIQYYINVSGDVLAPFGVGQLILVNCSDLTIVGSLNTTLFWEWDGGTVDIILSQNVTVQNNIIRGCNVGISIQLSEECTIRNCILRQCNDGIYIQYSNDTLITDCDVNNNTDSGITSVKSFGTEIVRCTLVNNRYGMRMHEDMNGIIRESDISNNSNDGLDIYHSASNLIIENTFNSNGLYGIDLGSDSHHNVIHHNEFTNNQGNNSQCYSDGWDNSWDDGKEGNLWSDWNGTGEYFIAGYYTSSEKDRYPIDTKNDNTSESKDQHYPMIDLMIIVILIFVLLVLYIVNIKIKK